MIYFDPALLGGNASYTYTSVSNSTQASARGRFELIMNNDGYPIPIVFL